MRDAEAAVSERGGLQKRIKELQEALEAEQGARGKLADKVQRKLAAAEQEVRRGWMGGVWGVGWGGHHPLPVADMPPTLAEVGWQLSTWQEAAILPFTTPHPLRLLAQPVQVGFLKAELESKVRQLKGLQGDMKAMQADADAKLDACEVRCTLLCCDVPHTRAERATCEPGVCTS